MLLRPKYWPIHLFAIAATVVAILMGLWQYNSWEAKRERASQSLVEKPTIPLTEALGPDDPFPADQVGRPVTFSGTWLTDSTVYVEDRPSSTDKTGYWQVTPLAVDGQDSAMLVVSWWLPSLEVAPDPPTGTATLTGRLQPTEGARISDQDPTDNVLPQLRMADAIQHVDTDLYGAYVVLDPEIPPDLAAEGIEAPTLVDLPDAGRMTALRNLFYSLEWWVFGLFAMFVWVRWMRDELHPEQEAASEAPADA